MKLETLRRYNKDNKFDGFFVYYLGVEYEFYKNQTLGYIIDTIKEAQNETQYFIIR